MEMKPNIGHLDLLGDFAGIQGIRSTQTTVMNSYVKPKMRRYLNNLEKTWSTHQIKSRLNIVRSDGGLMSVKAAAEQPVHTMLSGPSGGVAAVRIIGEISDMPIS